MGVGAGTPAREGHDILVPPRPAPHLEWGGGERDGDGVEVAEVGDDHQGGLPPHALLLLIVAMVLLPLAQSCWWQAVCHPGRPGDLSVWRGQREDSSFCFTFFVQPFDR